MSRGFAGRRNSRTGFACLIAFAGCALAGPATGSVGAEIREGWDFSLPSKVKPLPYAGLFFMGNPAKRPEIIHEGYTFDWKELNPEPGVYDFSRVKDTLDKAGEAGRGVVLRLKCSQTFCKTPWGKYSNVPAWVLERHKPPIVDMAGGEDETYPGVVIEVAAPWHKGLHKEYLRFVKAFGESGLPAHPALFGLYVHGISTSLGEEFWFTRTAYKNLAAAGMTPRKLKWAIAGRIRAWAKAFGEHRGKLAWVGAGWMDAGDRYDDYKRLRDELNQLALESDLGLRGGGIEWYNQLPAEETGQQLGPDGYIVSVTENVFQKEGRFFGDENEVYHGRGEAAPYMYRAAVLRALQMGMGFLWTNDNAVALDPEVSRYFNLTAGKRPGQTPDIWCYLREASVRSGGKRLPMRNFELGLMQREGEGYRTLPALFHQRPRAYTNGRNAGEWSARATNSGEGQKGIGFIVDRAYWPSRTVGIAALKVTFLDDGSVWNVRYATAGGIYETTSVCGNGDGGIKTASFILEGFEPLRSIEEEFDLALMAQSGDLTATFIRLIF